MSGTRRAEYVTAVDFGTLGVGATSAVWECALASDGTATFGGTFGGATVVLEGSDLVGGPYATLRGQDGALVSLTAAGVVQVVNLPPFLRARTVGGAGTAILVNASISGKARGAAASANVLVEQDGGVNRPELVDGLTGEAVRLRAIGSDTNIGLVLAPKGTGPLMAAMPDSAATGGNARGANAVDWQTLRGAATQVASADRATIGGGGSNAATATISTVSGGAGNAATSTAATVSGGQNNSATGAFSWVPGGILASTRGVYGAGAWASGRIAVDGDVQSGEHVLFRQTTDATATRLTADNAAASTTNTINLPNFGRYAGVLVVTASGAGGNNSAVWFVNVAARRGANAAATAVYLGAGAAIVPTGSEGTGSAWRLDIAADTTNGGISVTGTGAAATTINWAARFMSAQAVSVS